MNRILSLGIDNFRIFDSEIEIDFKPLTILTGGNGSGKSTVINVLKIISKWASINRKDINPELPLFAERFDNPYLKMEELLNEKNAKIFSFKIPTYFTYPDKNTESNINPYGEKKELFVELKFELKANNFFLSSLEILNAENDRLIIFEDVDGSWRMIMSRLFISSCLLPAFNNYDKDLNVSLSFRRSKYFPVIDTLEAEWVKVSSGSKGNIFNSEGIFLNDLEYNAPEALEESLNKNIIELFPDFVQCIASNQHPGYAYFGLSTVIEEVLEPWSRVEYFSNEPGPVPASPKMVEVFSFISHQLAKPIVDELLDINFTSKFYLFKGFTNFFIEGLLKRTLLPFINVNYFGKHHIFERPGIISETEHQNLLHDMDALLNTTIYNKYSPTISARAFLLKWVKAFGIGDDIRITIFPDGITTYVELRISNEKWVPITSLGFGFSKLLPLLIKIAVSIPNRHDPYGSYDPDVLVFEPFTLLLEEPEINLHPSLQSKLADLIVEASVEFNIQFIIETHSEYLIRKLQYLTAKGILNPKNAIIHYFKTPGSFSSNETRVTSITLDDEGGLSDDFGRGFFDEADNLAIDLYTLLTTSNKN